MRYLITKDFRKLILLNQEELSKNLVLKSNIKNLIYKNKTISLNDLNKVSKIINLKDLNFKEIHFSPQKNLGKHSQSPKINFTGKNKKFAELIGIILGDGNLYHNMLRITLSKNEKPYVNYIKELIYELFGITSKEYFSQRSNTITVYVYNKNLSNLILETLQKKIKFFKNDIREKNLRLSLNFGHTFAHSIEMITEKIIKKDYLRHGEAVGLGMLCEIMLSNNGKKNELYNLCQKILKKYNLPIKLNIYQKKRIRIHQGIYKGVFLDKKNKNNNPRYISLKKINKPQIKEILDYGLLNDTIFNIIENN